MRVEVVDITSIIIPDDRQRADLGDLTDLKASLRAVGLINPVVVNHCDDGAGGDQLVLVAGERRLTAATQLGWPTIPVRYFSDLDEIDQVSIELEENIKRKDLDWKDRVRAVQKLHQLHLADNPDWTQADLAKYLGYDAGLIAKHLAVADGLASGDPLVVNAPKLSTASGIVQRKNERKASAAKERLLDTLVGDVLGEPDGPGRLPEPDSLAASPIACADFNEWAPRFSGQRFNFIHCDFPYGVNADKFNQGSASAYGGYEDSPDVYWALIDTLLQNIDRICEPSAHLIFWFSMEYYRETLDLLSTEFAVNRFPLVWHKSDGAGILPDPNRGPRRTYETAFFATRGDRKIIQSVSNSVAAGVTRGRHMSEKSQAVLRHFFRMTIDDTSRVLDPTCGSGSALRAAHALGCTNLLGLEANPEFARGAAEAFEAAAAGVPDTELLSAL